MYLRFVISEKDSEFSRALGVFQALFDLRDAGELYPYEREQCEKLVRWFNENLKEPTRFTASKRHHYRKPSRAICWFKESAREHLERAWHMVAILENHQVPVCLVRTQRVGYIVYEDEHQIVAEPFAGTDC